MKTTAEHEQAEARAADVAALFAFHGADLRPGVFFVVERGGTTARVHETDLTRGERAALGLSTATEEDA